MAAYQLIAAVGATDTDGITTFINRPAGAPLFYKDDNGGWVPVGEASSTTSTGPGQGTAYTAGPGIDISAGNEISNTLDVYEKTAADARFGDLATQQQHTAAIGQLPQLATTAKTNLVEAVNEVAAQKANTAMLLTLSGTATPYLTPQQAADAATAGSTVLLRGYQPAVDFRKSLTIDANGANFGRNQLGLLPYPSAAVPLIIRLRGGAGSNRLAVIRQNSTSTAIVEDYVFGPAGWFELFGLFSDSPHITSVTLRRCSGTRSIGTANADQNGNVSFQCRSDAGQRMTVYLEDCDLTSEIGPVFTGLVHPDCRIYLRGTTKVTPANGSPLATLDVLDNGSRVPANLATIVVDERPTASAGTGIDYANELAVSVNTVATVYKAYVLQGAGCTLTLPNNAAVGSSLFLRVDDTATGLFNVALQDGTLLGQYWAKESVTYRRLGQGWRKQAPDLRAMSAKITAQLNDTQAFNQDTGHDLRLPVVAENTGLAAQVATANQIIIQRAGRYLINSSISVLNIQANGYYQFIAFAGVHVANAAFAAGGLLSNGTAYGGASFSAILSLPAGATIYPNFYSGSAGITTRADNAELLASLTVTELT